LAKIVIFHSSPLFDAPVRSLLRSIAISFATEKLEWWGYATVKKSLRIRFLVLTESTNVTDGQTDRQTDRQTGRQTDRQTTDRQTHTHTRTHTDTA